jgi:hypothetical protein
MSPHIVAYHELHVRLADLLADVETRNHGLDPALAASALVETAYGAALTFCEDSEHARRHIRGVVDALDKHHPARALEPEAAVSNVQTASKVVLIVSVAILAWLTIVFLARRGAFSLWNLIGPVFCTLLAMVTLYRFLVEQGRIRPWSFLDRGTRSRHP